MDLTRALSISAAGMDAQGTRLRIIAENLANQDTTATSPGGAPYRRQTVTFEDRMNGALGLNTVEVARIAPDMSPLPLRYEPSHPAADPNGYVQTPNVNSFVEVMDMREAERSYAANLQVLQTTRGMLSRTIGLLK